MLPSIDMPTSLENDLLFKETLAHPDNRDKLIYFLSCFTDFSLDYLNSVNLNVFYESILLKSKLKDKALRSDILIEFDNYKINLECYSHFNQDSFYKSLVYVMRIYSTNPKRGSKYYNDLDHVIGINLIDNVNKNTIITNQLYSDLMLIYNKELLLKNDVNLSFYRLDVAKNLPYNKNNKKEVWLKFIGAKNYEERKRIAKGDEKLEKLNEWVEEYVNDEKTNRIFGEWAERIAQNNFREEAWEQGIEQGERNSLIKTIQNMLKNNFTLEDISKATDLSITEIKKLLNENHINKKIN